MTSKPNDAASPGPASARKVVCFGEILWDLFPDGPLLGGAPANVAVHMAALGHEVSLISRVGDDDRGHEAIALLAEHGVDTAGVQLDMTRPTGIIQAHTMANEIRYKRVEGCAWQYIGPTHETSEIAASADVLYFGTLCQHYEDPRKAFEQLASRTKDACVRVCDLNLRPPQVEAQAICRTLFAADIVKLTKDEAQFVSDLLDVDSVADELLNGTRTKLIAITDGVNGASLHTTEVTDTHFGFPSSSGGDDVGAGDAFTAILIHGWLHSAGLQSINRAANYYASFIASQRGATPPIPGKVLAKVQADLGIRNSNRTSTTMRVSSESPRPE